jgi:hypothetical protein
MRCEPKYYFQYAFGRILQLIVALLALSSAAHAQTEGTVQCHYAQKLTGVPPGESKCIQDYKIADIKAPGRRNKIGEEIKFGATYSIAVSKSTSCNAIGFEAIRYPTQGPVLMPSGRRDTEEALASCKAQGCDCEIAVDDGRVLNFELLARSELREREQERLALGNQVVRQSEALENTRRRVDSEMRVKEQARVSNTQFEPNGVCHFTHKLTGIPQGNSTCMQYYKISEMVIPDLKKTVGEAIKSGDTYSIAVSKNPSCQAIGFSAERYIALPSLSNRRDQGLALANCKAKGCDCEIAVDDGRVLNFELLARSELREREQERVLAENKAKEQALLAEEARVRDEQRRIQEVRIQQLLKLEDEARLKAESEARAKDQERLMAENRAKDSELALLRAQLELIRQQTTQATPPAPLAKRKALIIGNDAYKTIQKLENAVADARSMAESLSKVGYGVTLKTNLTEKEMKVALRTFKSQVEPGDEVAIFYAGHGIQLENTNYLIPIDVAGDSPDQIKDDAIPLQRVLEDMSERKAKLTLALIDACRDNPFKSVGRSIGQGRGLAPTTAATGQMVVFSAGSGQQALDKLGPTDKEKNGLFTRIFIREMTKPDRTVDAVVRQVRNEVVRMAKSVGHEQVPAIYDQVVGEFYFARSGQ